MGGTLVTGGAGFIGSALVRLLVAEGLIVRVLDDFSSGLPENLTGIRGVELLEGSIVDSDMIRTAMDDVDVVFHLACKGVRHSIHSPIENHAVNATGTLLLLEEALRNGVERFVYTSTSEVFGSATYAPMDESHPTLPNTVYGGSKLAGESYVRAYHRVHGVPTVVVRPFNSYGPRSHHEGDSGEVIPRFLVRAMNGRPLVVFGDGMQTRDFTYVDDTARGIRAAAQHVAALGRTINLGSGVETSVIELARALSGIVGRGEVEITHEEPRPGDVDRLVSDSNLARELLDWSPVVGLKEGLGKLIQWHSDQGTDWESALEEEVLRNWESEPARGPDTGR